MNEYKQNFIQEIMEQGYNEKQALEMWGEYDQKQTEAYHQSMSDEVSNLMY